MCSNEPVEGLDLFLVIMYRQDSAQLEQRDGPPQTRNPSCLTFFPFKRLKTHKNIALLFNMLCPQEIVPCTEPTLLADDGIFTVRLD